jgi:hypothetical protein
MNQILQNFVDVVVPLGPFLRKVEHSKPFEKAGLLLPAVMLTFFFHWLFTFIPFYGSLIYSLGMVGLSAWVHIVITKKETTAERVKIFLWYFIVIIGGYGGLRNFIGHVFLSDLVAKSIGWEMGSPFQIELGFYQLGGAVAALLCIWFKDRLWVGVTLLLSIFGLGAAYVHLYDLLVHGNYSPNNVGSVLVGDILIPILLLTLLYHHMKDRHA